MDNQYVRQSLNSRRVCLLVSLSLSSERDRQTEKQFESSIWQTESRVSTMITDDTRFGLKFLVLFIHVHASSWAHQTECQVSTSIKCHWWINTRVWLSLMHDTRAWLTMTSLLSLNVKSFKCRKSVQSFNLEVFVRTSTFTDSHRLCCTPKTKKQIFYKFVRSFPSFCWTCSFQVHVLFLRHWGWYQMTKKKKQVGSASDS
jgi:hypothetical protein